MKRDVPATPFKVDGPNSIWTSSSELPENPVGQLATMTRAGAQEMATMTTLAKQGQRSSSSNAGGAAQQGGSASTGQLVEEFVKKVNYVLHGLRNVVRPSPKMMFEWLWHQIKGLGILRYIIDKVRESSQRSKKRSFEWTGTQISEELREKHHDMNYENVVKGLPETPPHQLALPATGEKPTRTPKPKKTTTVSQPATPGPVITQSTKKFPCALHTAGFCRFGDRCRNQHQGDPGSDTARKAYSGFLKNNPKGGDSSKGSGKQPGKGKNKSDGKGKKGDTKGNKSVATAPAAVAAAASTVTITEVEGKQVKKAWQSFCQFCDKTLHSLNIFLKLSVPILAKLILSIIDAYDQIGETIAASMVHPVIQNFKKYFLEFLGGTGSAHDIGSLRTLQDQGMSRDMVEPWMKALLIPVRFTTGGGPQLSTEALRVYTKDLGAFHIHLLESCPMALSIGRQVSRGHTFIWQYGHKPYIALNHRRCRVWCPSENRWYANRIQNKIPIFAIDNPLKPGKINKDETKHTQFEQPVACADLDTEDSRTAFCGSCLE